MADLQLQQQNPVLRLVLAASTAKPSNMKEHSTWVLVQQYSWRFLKNRILCRGQADQRCGALQQLVLPSSIRPDVQERSGTTSASARGALWCYALGKRKGIWCLVWSFSNALCLYSHSHRCWLWSQHLQSVSHNIPPISCRNTNW